MDGHLFDPGRLVPVIVPAGYFPLSPPVHMPSSLLSMLCSAEPGRPDQHDQRRIGQRYIRIHRPSSADPDFRDHGSAITDCYRLRSRF